MIFAGSGRWPRKSPTLRPQGSAIEIGSTLSRSVRSTPSELRQPGAAAEEERRLLAADGDDRDDRHAGVERQPDEALAAGEVDPVALPGGPVHLPVAAREDEHRGAGLERLARRARARRRPSRSGAGSARRARRGRGCGRAGRRAARRRSRSQKASVKTIVSRASGCRRSGCRPAAPGPSLGDVAHVADLAAEPEGRDQPGERQVLADVVGVAVVEVGGEASPTRSRERAERPRRRAARPAPRPPRRGRSPPARAEGRSTPSRRARRADRAPRLVAVRAVGCSPRLAVDPRRSPSCASDMRGL